MDDRLEGDGGLRPGLNVDIRRTDGRVHAATITAVDFRTGLVTVEWFEGGETKGKQLEVEALLRLNPALRIPRVTCNEFDVTQDKSPRRSSSPTNTGRKTRQADHVVDGPGDYEFRGRQQRFREMATDRRETDAILRRSSENMFEHRAEPASPRARKINRPVLDEEEALREVVKRYRYLIDVSELWMTADVRMLTRVASGRATEDAWVRELEELLMEKLGLLSELKDSVSRYRKIRDT
ncbi:kinesin-like protein KIF2A [Ornithodoros turicata]|uniref:kinesin-like protein KIF2A n=1 Tax=Ornithodoros turicata TaxID=34597 RepID=UPI003138C790